MTNFQPARTFRSIPASSSFLGQQGWSALDNPAVSYEHAVVAVSSSLVPFVRSWQAKFEALERERDALLSRVRTPETPEHFVMPLPPMIEVRSRIDEIIDAPFFCVEDDDY